MACKHVSVFDVHDSLPARCYVAKKNHEIAVQNGGITDLQPGEFIIDGEGERARFTGYGDNAPVYVNLEYQGAGGSTFKARLPNAELRRTR